MFDVTFNAEKQEIYIDGMEAIALVDKILDTDSLSMEQKATLTNNIMQVISTKMDEVLTKLVENQAPKEETPEDSFDEEATEAVLASFVEGAPLCIPLDGEGIVARCRVSGGKVGNDCVPCEHYAGMIPGQKLWCNYLNSDKV